MECRYNWGVVTTTTPSQEPAIMTNFDATHAYDSGFYYAVRGIVGNVPRGTWMQKFPNDWLAGYRDAIAEGKWGTHTNV